MSELSRVMYSSPLSAEFCHQQIYAAIQSAQAAAVRAAISPSELTLTAEWQSREEVAQWVDMYVEAFDRTYRLILAPRALPPG